NDLQFILENAGYSVIGIAASVSEAQEFIEAQKPDVVLLDIFLQGKGTGMDLAGQLTLAGIPFVYLSANSNQSVLEQAKATQPYGFIVKPFREKDLLITLQMILYRHAHRIELRLRQEQTLQIALTDTLSRDGDWDERLLEVTRLLQPHIPSDFLIMGLENDKDLDAFRSCSFYRIGPDEYQTIKVENFLQMTGLTLDKYQRIRNGLDYGREAVYIGADFEAACRRNPLKALIAGTFRLQSNLIMPLRTAQNGTFFLSFYSRRPDTYTPEHLQLMERLRGSLTLTIDRQLAFDQIRRLSDRLRQENTYLQEESKTTANFEEIIGTSPSLLRVFNQVSQVAAADTSVLILGESGPGKELIARAVHNLSLRRGKLLVKVNCAALPANLIESELFGHEKGAFTGATDRRIGKFELAHGGTIFLDEIGEMPLELQAKLLRVLQEKEIERLGGKGTIKTDVRIVAATNRNLEKEVAEGRFRLDLYYRLSVFPISLPALRERTEDIPSLAHFFGQKFSRKMGKPYHGIHENAVQELLRYDWPGNIRELENVIEQAVIINDRQSPLEWGRPLVNKFVSTAPAFREPSYPARAQTITDLKHLQQETEREYILEILQKAKWRIRGKGGAAELLNMKPTTLESRMQKLGISK
ncbi:MAG: sigma 54-interacting transcriptional regulator, partial [Cytophagales bacterium]|nr:sigma 54-interacting transcriptional regulator [Cytophagales bacterium]